MGVDPGRRESVRLASGGPVIRRSGVLVPLVVGLAMVACEGDGARETGRPRTEPAPVPGEVTVPDDPPKEPAPGSEPDASPDTASSLVRGWTAGIVRRGAAGPGVAFLGDLRIGRHEGYDRAVWEFEGPALPGYAIEYVDSPVRACGSGRTVELAGDGWLEVRFEPARAHTPAGEVPSGLGDREPGLPTILEARRTCDFEAVVTWVLGVASPEPYRVLELDEPARLVVDVRH